MKFRPLFIMFGLLILILVACSSESETTNDKAITTTTDLMSALQQQGISVTKGDQVEQPFFSVPAELLNAGETGIQVFEYSDEAAAQADADLVAQDGSSVGTSMPFWIGDPHFYKSGKLIVLYLGSDENILMTLTDLIGPQFAGR